MIQTSRKPRLCPRNWIDAAMVALAREGAQGICVESLAAELGVTKGSFYWHFKDRQALLQQVLEHWADASTDVVKVALESLEGTPEDRLHLIARMVIENELGRMDPFIRSWALRDPLAAATVRQVDEARMHIVSEAMNGAGFHGRELATRARALISFLAHEHAQLIPLSQAERLIQAGLFIQLLLRR